MGCAAFASGCLAVERAVDWSFRKRTDAATSSGVASLQRAERQAFLTRATGSDPDSRAIFVARATDWLSTKSLFMSDND